MRSTTLLHLIIIQMQLTSLYASPADPIIEEGDFKAGTRTGDGKDGETPQDQEGDDTKNASKLSAICPDGLHCLNGATCMEDSYDKSKYHCNCPASETPGIFAGKHCEAEGDSLCDGVGIMDDIIDTDYHDVNNGMWFCTNGGECLKLEEDLETKCDCPYGFYGLHCELEVNKICTLPCDNEGVCKFGIKDLSDFTDSRLDVAEFFGTANYHGMHCVCPAGFTGIQCEHTVENCGDGLCFHGATCVEHVHDDDNEPTYSCDCDSVLLEDPTAGLYCEHSATTYCPTPRGRDPKSYFCTNGGECPPPGMSYDYCSCPDGFSGPRCEFRAEDDEKCDLNCNAGKCFFGSGNENDSLLNQMDIYAPSDDFFSRESLHCKCQDGYDGEFCEHKIEVCGDEEHVCMNESRCRSTRDKFTCDCEAASTEFEAYAGKYCEMVSTMFCRSPSGLKAGKHSFCTNHGTCKGSVAIGEDHVGCDCREGFKGEFCEIRIVKKSKTNVAAIILLTVGLVLLVSVGGIFGRRYYLKHRQYEKHPQTEVQEQSMGEGGDLGERDLGEAPLGEKAIGEGTMREGDQSFERPNIEII